MKVSVLIPTYNRPEALAATLTAVAAQSLRGLDVVIADQGDADRGEQCAAQSRTVRTLCRLLELHGGTVRLLVNLPRRGIAQQRQFLLERATGRFSLFLDDDVILEADALERMLRALEDEGCGFTGMPLIGLSYRDDRRPHEQVLEPWEGPVRPEVVRPGSIAWRRHLLHNAANALHAGEGLRGESRYKVAWIGGCVLYDTAKLREVGGFEFWKELPDHHCGEDVLVQLRLLERHGGFGLLPSGAYHQELPTTITDRGLNAPDVFLAGAG